MCCNMPTVLRKNISVLILNNTPSCCIYNDITHLRLYEWCLHEVKTVAELSHAPFFKWSTVAQWLDRRLTFERLQVPIPPRPLGNFGNFLYPTLPVFFGGDTKSCWSLLFDVYAMGSKRSLKYPTRCKCVTCRGLHILPGKHVYMTLNKKSVKERCKCALHNQLWAW